MENGLMEEKDREERREKREKGTEADERGEETAIMVDDGQDSHERICPYGEIVSYKSFIDRKRAFRSILISLFLFLFLCPSIFLFIISSDRYIIPHERSPLNERRFSPFPIRSLQLKCIFILLHDVKAFVVIVVVVVVVIDVVVVEEKLFDSVCIRNERQA